MSHRKAFSLLIFLSYLLFFCILSCLIFYLAIVFVIPSVGLARKYQLYTQLHSATDLFVHDLRTSHTQNFMKISSDELIWSCDEKKICWRYYKNILERKETLSSKKKNKKSRSIILSKLHTAYFIGDYRNNTLIGMSMTVQSSEIHDKAVTIYVSVCQKD